MTEDYLRPQLERERWLSLDGAWRFSFDRTDDAKAVTWDREIRVPFPPESKLSGVHEPGFHPVVWYQRPFTIPEDWQGERVLLHFGAVDYAARVWVNGQLVVTHEGGHTPFSADITDVLQSGEQTVTVRAEDDPADLGKPRGKQDWLPEPHGIWYPRTTGIWQPVWLEPVSAIHLTKLRLTPDVAAFGVTVEAHTSSAGTADELRLEVRVTPWRRSAYRRYLQVDVGACQTHIAPARPRDRRRAEALFVEP